MSALLQFWVRRVRATPWACDLLCALALACVAILVYAPLLDPSVAPYSPHSDIVTNHLAKKLALHRWWTGGTATPFWSDATWFGQPLLTDPQALAFHPLHLGLLLCDPLRALGPTLVLMLWIAGVGGYALARVSGATRLGSLLSGTSGLLAFKLMAAGYAGWLSQLGTLVMLPAIAAAYLAYCQRPTTARFSLLAMCLAVVLAGATPQLLIYTLYLFGGYAAYEAHAAALPWLSWHMASRFAGLAGALVLALACSAYLWLPLASEWTWLARAKTDYAFFVGDAARGLGALRTLVDPELLGSPRTADGRSVELWEFSAYFGRLPLLGALTALVLSRPRTTTRYLAYVVAASLVLSIPSPLTAFAYKWLPAYGMFRLPQRMLFVTSFCGIALAAHGYEAWLGLVTRRGSRALSTLLAVVLLAATLIEGKAYAKAYLTVAPAKQLVPDNDHPVRALAQLDAGSGFSRIAVVDRSAFAYGWAEAAGVRLINGYDPYHFGIAARFGHLADQGEMSEPNPRNWLDFRALRRPDLLRELAVRYVVSGHALNAPWLLLRKTTANVRSFAFYRGFETKTLFLYELADARPLIHFATRIDTAPSIDAVEAALATHPVNGGAWLLARDAPQTTVEPALSDRIDALHYQPGNLRFKVAVRARALLVVSESFHPGWRASIDGQAARPVQANLALLGLWVPPGRHEVTLAFRPLHWELACVISVTGLVLLLALLGFSLARTRGAAHVRSTEEAAPASRRKRSSTSA